MRDDASVHVEWDSYWRPIAFIRTAVLFIIAGWKKVRSCDRGPILRVTYKASSWLGSDEERSLTSRLCPSAISRLPCFQLMLYNDFERCLVFFFIISAYLVVCSAHFKYSPRQQIQCCPAGILFSSGRIWSCTIMFCCGVINRLLAVPGLANTTPDIALIAQPLLSWM